MIAVDIVGEQWSNYSRDMSRDEIRQHGKPILSAGQQLRESLAESGINIDRVEGNTVHMSVDESKRKKKKSSIDKQPALSEEELRELDGDDSTDLGL